MEKRLYRSRTDKMVAGVAGGIAKHFEVDPAFVRLAFVLLAFLSHGVGFIVYIVAVIVIPKEPLLMPFASNDSQVDPEAPHVREVPPFTENKSGTRRTFGLVLVIFGAFLLLRNMIPSIEFVEIFPIMLILLGAWILVNPSKNGVINEQ